MSKWKLVGAGVVCCGISVLFAADAMNKTSWRKADAQVTALVINCHMKATEHSVGYKTVYEKDIPCDAVEVFKTLHSDKSWSTTEQFNATLQVSNVDGAPVTAEMSLHRKDGIAPVVGDVFPVLQNPANPNKVARADITGTGALFSIGFGVVGALVLWLAFGGVASIGGVIRGGRKAEPQYDPADMEGSAKRADAMIAAAMAQMNKPAPKSAQKPVFATATPRAAPMVQGRARTSFGLKR